MQKGMNLEDLLTEVIRQNDTKRDFVASTQESIRMVPAVVGESDQGPKIVLLKGGDEQLERFSIADNCHRQIASRLAIPFKYYTRLLADHLDLVMHQVNALFEREPETRLVRTLDGTARAFLSNRYRRLDNAEVLQQVLPPIVKGDIETQMLSTNVGPNALHIKALFIDESLKQTIGTTPKGTPDTVQPYAVVRNSETGNGSLSVRGGFFRGYCLNGCIFGREEAFNFSRNHVGGQLIEGTDFEIFTDSTKRKQDETIIAEVTDAFHALADADRVREMADKLRALKEGATAADPFGAVDQLVKELDLRESEKNPILGTFLRDQDFTKWGVLNAVTEVANNAEVASYERAQELEEVGAKIINLNAATWQRIMTAEKIAA